MKKQAMILPGDPIILATTKMVSYTKYNIKKFL